MKFEDVDKNCLDLFEDVRDEYFSELSDAFFKLVYRNKRKGKDETLVIAEISTLSEMSRFFTSQEAENETGYDYIIIIDKLIFQALDDQDKKRILRHELRHCNVDNDKDVPQKWKIRTHTIEDFHEDVKIESENGGDLYWKEKIVNIGLALYDELNEKENKKKNKK